MPRKRREESPTSVYHWICRGMNKKHLFHRPNDYHYFKELLKEYSVIHEVRVFHYCLMTNHVHLLIQSPSIQSMAKFSQMIQRRYAYYYCATYKWAGSVFQRGYRSIPVLKDTHLLECARYIERNPLKANLAGHPADYPYTSFHYYGCGKADDLLTASPAYLDLAGNDNDRLAIYAEYVTEYRPQEEVAPTIVDAF